MIDCKIIVTNGFEKVNARGKTPGRFI